MSLRFFRNTSFLLIGLSGISCSQHSKEMPEVSAKDQVIQTKMKGEASMESSSESLKAQLASYKLPNGLEVFLIEKKAIPMATVLIAVRNGSFIETQDNNGLAHLYEHMFFKANEKIPSQPEFLQALDEMGIELGPNMNAYTSTESVRYFFTIQTQYLIRGLGFMADALISPKFLQDELERERKVVIGEFDRFEASPHDVFFQKQFMKRMFSEHFVRKNVIGSRPVILNASRDQMHDIQHRYYVPNNSALFVVGEFDVAAVKAEIEKKFGPWPQGPNPLEKYPVPEHPSLQKTETFYEEANVQNVEMAVGFHGPKLSLNNKELVALDLASTMLGYQSSPFQKELIHSNIASQAAFWTWSQRYTSPLIFSVETTPENAQAGYDKLMDLVKRIRKGGFFQEKELKTAQTSFEISSAYDRESGQKFALNLASIWSSTGDLNFYTDYVELAKNITLKDIDEALAKYLNQAFIAGALIPKGSKPPQMKEI